MRFDWLNCLLFLALSAGHAALVVAIINRAHARPLPQKLLHRVRQLHDVVIVLLPALFVWLAGLRGPRILYGGSWHQLPSAVLAYLAVCGVVALALPVIAIRRRLAGQIPMQISNH